MNNPNSTQEQDTSADLARYNLAINIAEIQAQQESFEQELEDLKIKLEANSVANQEQLRNLERAVLEVRDKARDAMHVSIGVDGRNGLRGSLESLVRDVASMSESLNIVKQSASNYADMKALMLRLFAASAMTILCQFGGAVWLVSSLHSRQEDMRQDLNRVLALLDKHRDDQIKSTAK